MRSGSQQCMLDSFFASLRGQCGLLRGISDRAFAKARSHLHMPALNWLNDWLLARADQAGLLARWQGLRLVAADASVLVPAIRSCHRARCCERDQRLFALYLPGAELTLHAAVHSAQTCERTMLVQALDTLGPDDVLLLDRGYPAAWLVQLLQERGIRFIMRCDSTSGWAAVRQFMRSGLPEAMVCLNQVSAQDALAWGCGRTAPSVRLVANVAPNGAMRVLATNLDCHQASAPAFGDLYHQRWRIEEAFKRLKHRLHLEAVSGLSQQALIVDVAAKVLADNIASLMCAAALGAHPAGDAARRCNRVYAAVCLQRALPRLLLSLGDGMVQLAQVLQQLAANTQRFVQGRSRPRPAQRIKPHARYAYKG